jgi:hypothetical protein
VRREEDDMIIDQRKDMADEHYWHRNSMKYGAKHKRNRKRKYRFIPKGRMLKANTEYHSVIRKLINKYNIKKIFLLTDSGEVVEEFRKMYGDTVVFTDCKRLSGSDPAYSLENTVVKRRRGIETIKDAYIAAQCDFFIGNDFSSLSRAISRMKDWPAGNARLLYRQRERRKYPINVKMIVANNKKVFRLFAEYMKKLCKKIKKKLNIGGTGLEN